MSLRLSSQGYHVQAFSSSEEVLPVIRVHPFDLALVDLKLKNENGIDVMQSFQRINPEMPIIILTAYGTISSAVDAMKKGASSYITKPFDYNDLLRQIDTCLGKKRLCREIKDLKDNAKDRYSFEDIVVDSMVMKKVLKQVRQAAKTDSIVHIEGESGTGKELIAKALHAASHRRNGPFVGINCAAIPGNLIESELFGYEKGAFTGAVRSNKGFFAQAEKGSFFLDEISEMSLTMQSKLLRVLEERECYPLGSSRPVKLDTRIIVASNKNLADEVEKGNFRKDLYYRIHVIPLVLPPLRERKEEIPVLAQHFFEKLCQTMNRRIKGISQAALQKMMLHDWPGNVRELENTIEYAVAMTTRDVITEDLVLQDQLSVALATANTLKPLKKAKHEFEKNYITELIAITRGNVSQAAKLAGKYRADFYDLLRKYHLKPDDFRGKK
jgi:two-component system response regulator GlrR